MWVSTDGMTLALGSSWAEQATLQPGQLAVHLY